MKIIRWTVRGIAICVGLVLIVAMGLFAYLRGSLPDTKGDITLDGLKGEASISRDANGIPHIRAGNEEDALFALGYAHAQDRLWQMEINRRIAAGRLAEAVGPKALDIDKFIRGIGIYRAAERSLADLDTDTRALYAAYARGVNAFLAKRKGPLPPEFLVFGIEPEAWKEADSIAFTGIMALDLSGNWQAELNRMRLFAKLSPKQIQELYPPYPGDAPVALPDMREIYADAARDIDLARIAEASPPERPDGIGSNNWVISGAHTKSGKPMLANDPHLGLTTPSIWYLAHISAPGLDATGTTFAGSPGIILGRNDRIAWGFTNTGPDTQDLYIERIDPADPAKYLTPDGSAPFDARTEEFKVKGGETVSVTIRSTRHGPVISDISERYARMTRPGHVLALAWTTLMPGDRTAAAAPKLMRARNWDEFRDTLRNFHSPQQNIVFADVDGNIGYIAPARIPVRRADNDLHGLAPAPGWDRRYDWQGYIPFDELPQVYNPASGVVITANHKIVGPDYPHFLTVDWSDNHRAERIIELIGAREGHDFASFEAIQTDVKSGIARDLLPLFKKLYPTKGADAETEAARALLDGWDGFSRREQVEPLLFHAWYRELTRLVTSDELGEMYSALFVNARPRFIANVLNDVDGQSRWCDDIRTNDREDCAALVAKALRTALDDLKRRYGADMTKWSWGHAHRALAQHRPLSSVDQLRPFIEAQAPTMGDSYTVNVGRHDMTNDKAPFGNVHAAGYRGIFDLSDLTRSRYVQSTGQSGNPLSDHFHRFVPLWADGRYIEIGSGESEADRLVLKPSGRM